MAWKRARSSADRTELVIVLNSIPKTTVEENMFNLIVAGGTRNNRQDSLLVGRVFEHTEDRIVEKFKPNGRLDIRAVCSLPTLFGLASV